MSNSRAQALHGTAAAHKGKIDSPVEHAQHSTDWMANIYLRLLLQRIIHAIRYPVWLIHYMGTIHLSYFLSSTPRNYLCHHLQNSHLSHVGEYLEIQEYQRCSPVSKGSRVNDKLFSPVSILSKHDFYEIGTHPHAIVTYLILNNERVIIIRCALDRLLLAREWHGHNGSADDDDDGAFTAARGQSTN